MGEVGLISFVDFIKKADPCVSSCGCLLFRDPRTEQFEILFDDYIKFILFHNGEKARDFLLNELEKIKKKFVFFPDIELTNLFHEHHLPEWAIRKKFTCLKCKKEFYAKWQKWFEEDKDKITCFFCNIDKKGDLLGYLEGGDLYI